MPIQDDASADNPANLCWMHVVGSHADDLAFNKQVMHSAGKLSSKLWDVESNIWIGILLDV